jgi:diadenosine tetraphosphatase ApaH/serine/threonine PP2A family protein phosphatase
VVDEAVGRMMVDLMEMITFVGHTHQLKIYKYCKEMLESKKFRKMIFPLAKTSRYIINIGSVGQPRDGYNKAKYAIWDSEQNTVESRHVDYDIAKAAKKMKRTGISKRYVVLLEKAKM